MSGKGDSPRPVNHAKYRAEWDRIFKAARDGDGATAEKGLRALDELTDLWRDEYPTQTEET